MRCLTWRQLTPAVNFARLMTGDAPHSMSQTRSITNENGARPRGPRPAPCAPPLVERLQIVEIAMRESRLDLPWKLTGRSPRAGRLTAPDRAPC